MENVTFIEVETMGEVETFARIDNGDGSFTTMLKSTYDAMIADE